jgi:hypothetical protein
MPFRSQATPVVSPVTHVIVGAASGIIATVGVQLLLVVLSEQRVARAVHSIAPNIPPPE